MAKLTAEAAVQFQEGINLMLSRWHALVTAVHNELGGKDSYQKAQQLPSHLFSLLTQSNENVYIDEVEHFLYEFMLTFTYQMEDGSVEEIAEKLMIMHEECLEGNYDSIKRLREADPPRWVPYYIQQDDSDDDDDNNTTDEILSNDEPSAMDVDAPETSSRHFQVDVIDSPQADDGWTVVRRSRRNRGRNN